MNGIPSTRTEFVNAYSGSIPLNPYFPMITTNDYNAFPYFSTPGFGPDYMEYPMDFYSFPPPQSMYDISVPTSLPMEVPARVEPEQSEKVSLEESLTFPPQELALQEPLSLESIIQSDRLKGDASYGLPSVDSNSYHGDLDKKYGCNFPNCSKDFSTSAHLKRHLKIHTGIRPFGCVLPGCTRSFTRRDNMLHHAKNHAKLLGTRLSQDQIDSTKVCLNSYSRHKDGDMMSRLQESIGHIKQQQMEQEMRLALVQLQQSKLENPNIESQINEYVGADLSKFSYEETLNSLVNSSPQSPSLQNTSLQECSLPEEFLPLVHFLYND